MEIHIFLFLFQMSHHFVVYQEPLSETDLECGGCDIWADHNMVQICRAVNNHKFNTSNTLTVAHVQNNYTVNTSLLVVL